MLIILIKRSFIIHDILLVIFVITKATDLCCYFTLYFINCKYLSITETANETLSEISSGETRDVDPAQQKENGETIQ